MKIASLIMAGAVALAGTAAFAQNEAPSSVRDAGGRVADSGRQMGHDAKEAGSRIGDAAKRGWNKLRGKSHDAKDTAKADHDMKKDDTRAMGASRDTGMSGDASRRQRMDDAYANWKDKNGDLKK